MSAAIDAGAIAPIANRRPFPVKWMLLVLIVGAVVIAGARYGYDWWNDARFMETTDDAYVGGDVTVIAPKVSGFVEKVLVADNQQVHAGDLLLKLDDRDYRAALANAEATVAVRQAAIGNSDATRRLQLSTIAAAAADIAAAQAEIVRARQDADRYQALSQSKAASVQRQQTADATYKVALAAEQRAQATHAAARQQLAVIAAEDLQARASLAQAIADRDLARLNLGHTELRAPIDGTVGNRAAREGSYAAIGARLMALVPAQGLWVEANFKETQLQHLHPGLSASVVADGSPGQVFKGQIVSLAPATGSQFSVLPAENATGNFTRIVQRVPVRIVLEGEGALLGALRPGLSVTVRVDSRSAAH